MSAVYQITVKGHLDTHWSAWFDNMTITNEVNGEAVLRGLLPDQSALYGGAVELYAPATLIFESFYFLKPPPAIFGIGELDRASI